MFYSFDDREIEASSITVVFSGEYFVYSVIFFKNFAKLLAARLNLISVP